MHSDTGTPPHPESFWLFELPEQRWDVADASQVRQRVPQWDVDILTAVSENETWIYVPMRDGLTGEAAELLGSMLGVESDALPQFRHRRLELQLALGDSAGGARQNWHYTSQTDIPPEIEDEFNRWFEEEHLPQLSAVAGTVHAARYRTDGSPRYLACYDLEQREVQGNAEWRNSITTPWRERIHKEFLRPRRLMLRRL